MAYRQQRSQQNRRGLRTKGAKNTSSYILHPNFFVFCPSFRIILSPSCIATSVSKRVHHRSLALIMTCLSTALPRSTSAQGKAARSISLVKYSVMSSPPYLRFMRESGMMIPSSTQAIVVVWAPMSTTQALERPAPNVAQIASCNRQSPHTRLHNDTRWREFGGGVLGEWQLWRSPW
jgi:hypothetical protein